MVPEIGTCGKFCFFIRMGARRRRKLFFVEREDDVGKVRADSSRSTQQQRTDSSEGASGSNSLPPSRNFHGRRG